MLQYPGVVAWFCALKLELYATYVLDYEDVFGVFEWGSGGIVHLHLLGWRSPGVGRHDVHGGEVPSAQRKDDARSLAWQHGAEIAEWNLGREDDWPMPNREFDEGLTERIPDGEEEAEEEVSGWVKAQMESLKVLLRDPEWH